MHIITKTGVLLIVLACIVDAEASEAVTPMAFRGSFFSDDEVRLSAVYRASSHLAICPSTKSHRTVGFCHYSCRNSAPRFGATP